MIGAVALLAAACSSSNGDRPQETAAGSATNQTTTTSPPASTITSSTSPAAAPADTKCGTVQSTIGDSQDVYIRFGSTDCQTAMAVFTRYFSDQSLPREGSGAHAAVNGFDCMTTSPGMLDELGYTAWCGKNDMTVSLITVPAGHQPPSRQQQTQQYTDEAGMVTFQSPSKRWFCGFTTTDLATAGCSGGMPSNAPLVANAFAPHDMVKPNGVQLRQGSPASFISTEDAAYNDPQARVLAYGDTLTVGSITCSVDPTTGVTCTDGQHGFRVSTGSYQLS